ncbi:MAG: hypothetical protein FIA97_11760 [Methylococcaceae bacterium]|nr:hypothetical protein [Methylococcaceae bacterium]
MSIPSRSISSAPAVGTGAPSLLVLRDGGVALTANQQERLLGLVRFRPATTAAGAGWPEAAVPLPSLAGSELTEAWIGVAPARYGSAGTVAYGHDGTVLFACCQQEGGAGELPERVTHRSYRALLDTAREQGYPYLLRVWNYFPDINGELAGLERYQRFSLGRYQALEEAGYRFGSDLPAASAVGSRLDQGYCLYLLAARQPGLQIENPRQVSAYRYPAQYGPRSPSFARATLAEFAGEQLLFVSGTASIAGHASLHQGDPAAQLAETLLNIQTLLDQPTLGCRQDLATLGDAGDFKVYLRHAGHADVVREKLAATLHPESSVIYLEGDICRSDLLLEIEAVIRLR